MTITDPTLISRTRLIWIAALAPWAVASLLSLTRDTISAATGVLILVLVIVAVSSAGDRLAGLFAAGMSGLAFDFFLTEPYSTLTIDDPDDIEATLLLVVIGVAVAEIAVRGRRAATRASHQSGYLEGVLQATAAIRDSTLPRDQVLNEIARQIAQVLSVPLCRVASGTRVDPRMAQLGPDGEVTFNGVVLDVDANGLPATQEIALVPVTARAPSSYFVVASGDHIARPSRERRRVAVLLATQAADLLSQAPDS